MLGLDYYITTIDSSYSIQKKDIKEVVEALVGASYKINGLIEGISTVEKMKEFASRSRVLIHNFKGHLLELNEQQSDFSDKELETIRVGGPDHSINR